MVRLQFFANETIVEDLYISERFYYKILKSTRQQDIGIPTKAVFYKNYPKNVFKEIKFVHSLWYECLMRNKLKNAIFFLGHFINKLQIDVVSV